MKNIIDKLYHQPQISRLFHTLLDSIQQELKDCHSVLDLGCGPESPLKYCPVDYSLGVDVFKPYIRASKEKKIHSDYLLADIAKVKFKKKSFNAVILIDVIEHLPKKTGVKLLRKAEQWAKKKILVSTPNGYLAQKKIDNNPHQAHYSGWTIKEMKDQGYKAYGMAGWKFLRKTSDLKKGYQEGDVLATIRFQPKIFWLFVSELTQAIVYYLPELAFEVFYVKNL